MQLLDNSVGGRAGVVNSTQAGNFQQNSPNVRHDSFDPPSHYNQTWDEEEDWEANQHDDSEYP